MGIQARLLVGLLSVALLSACGSGGSPPRPDSTDSPAVVEQRIDDLMRRVGDAVVYQNWHMLASLHGTVAPPTEDALAATFANALPASSPLTDVVEVKALDGGAYAVTVGTGPDTSATKFQGVTITAVPEEISGHYVVRELAVGS